MVSVNRFLSVGLVCLSLITISRSANAYIDAGSGSYLLQVLFAGLLGGIYFAKTAILNLKLSFQRKHSSAKSNDNPKHVN